MKIVEAEAEAIYFKMVEMEAEAEAFELKKLIMEAEAEAVLKSSASASLVTRNLSPVHPANIVAKPDNV